MPFVDDYRDAFMDGGWAGLTTGKYRLYSSDPSLADNPSDVELGSDGGYTPADFDPGDWTDSDDGQKTASVTWGTSTDAFSDVGGWWGVTAGSDADDLEYYDVCDDPVDVEASGVDTTKTLTIQLQDGGS